MKINKATFEALPEAMKAAFKQVDGNADQFDNGEEEVSGLKTALAKEKADREEFGKRLADYDAAKTKEIEAARKKALEDARTTGDFAAIEKDYQRQIKDLKESTERAERERVEGVQADAVKSAAADIAKMFVSPGLATPAIMSRLKAEIVDGKAIVRVLDKTGAASAGSLEDLKKEYLTDKELKGSLVASNGSGGGFTLPKEGDGFTSGKDDKFDAANATPADMVARLEAKGIGSDGDDD